MFAEEEGLEPTFFRITTDAHGILVLMERSIAPENNKFTLKKSAFICEDRHGFSFYSVRSWSKALICAKLNLRRWRMDTITAEATVIAASGESKYFQSQHKKHKYRLSTEF